MEANKLLEELLKNTPEDVLIKQWEEIDKMDLGGPYVEDFLKQIKE
jgi:hypothetical protein